MRTSRPGARRHAPSSRTSSIARPRSCRAMAERIIDGADGTLRLYEAAPDGQAQGAVIVIAEAFGVNDYIEDVVRRFAAAGYHAVAPDLFYRSGRRRAAYDDFASVPPLFEGVTPDTLEADLDLVFADL